MDLLRAVYVLVDLEVFRKFSDLYHILFGFLDGVLDVKVCLSISNGVTNTNRMT